MRTVGRLSGKLLITFSLRVVTEEARDAGICNSEVGFIAWLEACPIPFLAGFPDHVVFQIFQMVLRRVEGPHYLFLCNGTN
jgi:hypothetical protein